MIDKWASDLTDGTNSLNYCNGNKQRGLIPDDQFDYYKGNKGGVKKTVGCVI
jgi:hypothetical protein